MNDWSSWAVPDEAHAELWSKCTAAPELSVTLLPTTVPNTGELTSTVDVGAYTIPNSAPPPLTFTEPALVTRKARFFGTPFRFRFPPRVRLPVTQMRTSPAGETLMAPGAE